MSCIDCGVTFYGDDFAKHTRCISEAEKHQKSLYIPKASQHKSPKQQKKRAVPTNTESDSDNKLTKKKKTKVQETDAVKTVKCCVVDALSTKVEFVIV